MFFSVIVPVYKVEDYLRRCIESVLCQSFSDFELILVDDGSPDGCPMICDEYAEKDSRIKVIHRNNGGLVSARQAGIKEAVGEYIFNLDSDDAIMPDALLNAYEIIKSTDCDIVSFSYKCYKQGVLSEAIDEPVPEGLYNKTDIKQHILPKVLVDENMQHIFYFLWGKAIRRSLVKKHQLNVNTRISLGEDLSCIVPCYFEAEKVYISNKVAYLYTIRSDSISTRFNTKQITQIEDVIKGLYSIDIEKTDGFKNQISRYSCFMCFAIIAVAAEGNHFSSLKEIKRLISNSVHKREIKNARFKHITLKSSIAVFMIKKGFIGLAFYFLNLCKTVKIIMGKKG